MAQWSGQGICYFPAHISLDTLTKFHTYFKSKGITKVRANYDYLNNSGNDLALMKTALLQAKSEGMYVVAGITQNSTTVTDANKAALRTAVLAFAQWCQDNNMDECQIGNEIEYHNDGTTLTDAQAITFISDLATEVQAIYTIGPVTYSSGHNDFIRALWVTNGLGGLDFIDPNIYLGTDDTGITELSAWRSSFGTQMRVCEWGVDATSLANFSNDWRVIQKGVEKMLRTIQSLGIVSAYYFCWNDATFGVVGSCNNSGNPQPYQLIDYNQTWNPIATNLGQNGRYWIRTY